MQVVWNWLDAHRGSPSGEPEREQETRLAPVEADDVPF
jgi:hypothetical protein